ncbi:MAG: TIGR03435 family protein [Terracidiphilus sp.]
MLSLELLFVAAILVASPALVAQNAAAQGPQAATAAQAPPQFDVAAIHLHEPQPHEHVSITSSPWDGRLYATNVSLFTLIWWSFEIPESRILGAPSWANSKRFDIEATADPSVDAQLKGLTSDAGRKEKEKMVQALLADRFKLATHTETRELPIYTLVVAKGGPKLGALQDSGTSINRGSDRIEVQTSNSVPTLAEQLSMIAGRDVVDQTGITGRYDLKLQWTPDDGTAPAADSGPSIFTALEEQLGLKLEPARGPVKVLVIDRVEMPSAN